MLLSTPSCDHRQCAISIVHKSMKSRLRKLRNGRGKTSKKLFQDFISLIIRKRLKSAFLMFMASCFNADTTFCLYGQRQVLSEVYPLHFPFFGNLNLGTSYYQRLYLHLDVWLSIFLMRSAAEPYTVKTCENYVIEAEVGFALIKSRSWHRSLVYKQCDTDRLVFTRWGWEPIWNSIEGVYGLEGAMLGTGTCMGTGATVFDYINACRSAALH